AEFVVYLRACEVYVGEPPEGRSFAEYLNPDAQRVVLPGLYFRGLHPDIAIIPEFRGPFSFAVPNTQGSVIITAAKALGLSVSQTEALFNEKTYQALGFFELYDLEKKRILELFRAQGVDL